MANQLQIDNPKKRRLAGIVDVLAKIILFPLIILKIRDKKIRLNEYSPRRILLIRLDHLGDTILFTPAIKKLKEKFPEAEIMVLAASWSESILKSNPNISRLLFFDCPWWIRLRGASPSSFLKSAVKYFQLMKEIRKFRPDTAIEFRGDFRQILFFQFFSGAKVRVSFDRTGGKCLLSHPIYFEKSMREIEKNLNLLSPFGIQYDIEKILPDLYETEESKKRIEDLFDEKGIDIKKTKMVVHLGARTAVKRWLPERFFEVIKYALEKHDAYVFIIGGKEDKEIIAALPPLNDERYIDLTGALTLLESYSLLKRCNLFIGNDSGAMHLASAADINIILLAGPSDKRTHPASKNAIIIKKVFDCSPCLELSCEKQNHPLGIGACMSAIPADEVKQMISFTIYNLPRIYED